MVNVNSTTIVPNCVVGKCGMLNGERIDAKMVETLAKIPSKEVLISKLLYLLQSPVRSVAIALNAIAEKKGE